MGEIVSQSWRHPYLLVLADHLERVVAPAVKRGLGAFDMEVFAASRKPVGRLPRNVDEAHGCGYAGCAIGWAFTCPVLRQAGIDEQIAEVNRFINDETLFEDPSALARYSHHEVAMFSWLDIQSFFGIAPAQADRMFLASSYEQRPPTIDDVVARIRLVYSELRP